MLLGAGSTPPRRPSAAGQLKSALSREWSANPGRDCRDPPQRPRAAQAWSTGWSTRSGLGPLEPLAWRTKTVTEHSIGQPLDRVYVESAAARSMTDVTFRDHHHGSSTSPAGTSARFAWGSREPPLLRRAAEGRAAGHIISGAPASIDGPSMSIRKFAKRSSPFDRHWSSSHLATRVRHAQAGGAPRPKTS